jgi:hypothetical protein
MNKRKELLENEVCSIVRGEERGGGGEGGGAEGERTTGMKGNDWILRNRI